MMKRALINLLFVLSTVLIANGQSGSRAAELFTAADGSFSVAFPKPPMIVGENHRVEISPNEVYSVLYLDRPTPTVDEFERRLRLAYTKKPGAKAIVHQGYSGSEYKDVDMSRETEDTGRVFFVKQRLFRIQVRTPILRTLPEALRRAYEKKLAAFFSSFKIRTIPPVRPPVVPVMPVDIGTLMEENVYTSPYFGFTVRLPRDWEISDPDLVVPDQPVRSGTDYPASLEELNLIWHKMNYRQLVQAYREWGRVGKWPLISIRAYRPDEHFESLSKYVEQQTVGGESLGMKLLGPITAIDLDGQRFLTYELVEEISTGLQTEKPRKGRIFITELDGIYLSIELIEYKDESDEKLLMEAVKSIRFSQRNSK